MSESADLYRFILAIPVADRPSHLRSCLESIAQQCRRYNYGGQDATGRYQLITVVVAEDSRDPQHIRQHQDLAEAYRQRGLDVIHFDLPEQYRCLQALPDAVRNALSRLLTTQPEERFYRKGQAANRNLSYLKMLQLTEDRERTLYYLVDSDQRFLPELDYFHHINHIFHTTDTLMLTGKLVGDPPVSPAVMAANFLEDVTAFLQEIADFEPLADCCFHRHGPIPADAAYHDMAQLFGFAGSAQSFAYPCPLAGPHHHADCLHHFAERLTSFFFGEHLTRTTHFQADSPPVAVTPARTIYPGNYIVNVAGLKYVIPFGHLRLRMSGPTAGRLVQAEIGPRFVSANLPMLHRRSSGTLHGDFRPGVEAQSDMVIDLSDEFERQFFGDLMLFSVVEWLKRYDLEQLTNGALVQQVVNQVEIELLALYEQKHQMINQQLAMLESWIGLPRHWWHDTQSLVFMQRFLNSMQHNFGDHSLAWQQIQSASHRQMRKRHLVEALRYYRQDRDVWDQLFSAPARSAPGQ